MSFYYEKKSTDLDTIFEVLADDNCRYVLSYLKDMSDDVASRDELASHVDSHVPDSSTEERVTIALHHLMLPKLEDAGLLEYDPRSATVRYWGHPQLEFILAEVCNQN